MRTSCLVCLCLILSGCSIFDSTERPFTLPTDDAEDAQRDPELSDYPSFVKPVDAQAAGN